MSPRSWLFVPGDHERKLLKGLETPADALILDLEDSVLMGRKSAARGLVRATLQARSPALTAQLWVRINPLDTAEALADLIAIVGAAPDGIVLPKAAGPADVLRLSHYLDALEAHSGLVRKTGILPIASETAQAALGLSEYAHAALPRLIGLTWGAEDLSAALGAGTQRDATGEWAFTYRVVRSACLLTAKAAGVQAVETLQADFRDADRLRRSTAQAAEEGFTGRLAIHPDQVVTINEAFMPSAAQVEYASRVLAAFAAQPQAGVVSVDGSMLDLPHLKRAQQVLDRQEH